MHELLGKEQTSLYALDQHRPRSRCLPANLPGLAIFGRVVPASEVLGVLEFQHDQPLGLPVALDRLCCTAACQELAAIAFERWINQFAVLFVGCWIFYFDIYDKINGHVYSSLSIRAFELARAMRAARVQA